MILQSLLTRNEHLWQALPNLPNLRVSLSIDDVEEAKYLSKEKVICVPDVDHGQGNIYHQGQLQAKCNGWWCDRINKVTESDCVRDTSHLVIL